MTRISAEFRFNKAGQGCFYTGFLHNGSQTFSMVYDCGTHTKGKYLDLEIYKFNVNLQISCKEKLDLLIISHFDEDHVNKILYLLGGIVEVEYVVLPYLSPLERLLVFLKTDDPSDDYRNFIIDPITYLKSQGTKINNILFIEGDYNNEDIKYEDDNPAPVDNLDKFEYDYTELKEIDTKEFSEYSEVQFLSDKGRFKIKGLWEFYFYNSPIDPISHITLLMILQDNIHALKDIDNITPNDLQNILASDNLTFIKDAYTYCLLIPNLNPTSLIVLHGPTRNNRLTANLFRRRFWQSNIHHEKVHTLLTGDIYLKDLTFSTYIQNMRNRIGILQIPHHGSEKLWDFTKLSSVINHWCVAVINFGLGNTYKHPTQKVVNDLYSAGWKIKLNHQLKSFKYFIEGRF